MEMIATQRTFQLPKVSRASRALTVFKRLSLTRFEVMLFEDGPNHTHVRDVTLDEAERAVATLEALVGDHAVYDPVILPMFEDGTSQFSWV